MKNSKYCSRNTAGSAYYVLHPQKDITICVFFNLPSFKNREGIISRKFLLSDLGILVSQNDIWTNSCVKSEITQQDLSDSFPVFEGMVS